MLMNCKDLNIKYYHRRHISGGSSIILKVQRFEVKQGTLKIEKL